MASKKDIVDLETKFWNAIRDRETEAAVALMADPCTLSGAQGVMALTREDYARMAADGSWQLHDFKMDKVDVQFPADDVAIIGYIVNENLTVEGKKLKLKAAESSTWVKQDGEWLCAAHTESVLGDPFGRDRQPVSYAA
jgi:ketosteroid isomerase-like protein